MDPHHEYTKRLEARRAAVAKLDALHIRLGNFRLAIALAAAALAWLTLVEQAAAAWWLLAPAIFFIALAVYHDAVLRWRDEPGWQNAILAGVSYALLRTGFSARFSDATFVGAQMGATFVLLAWLTYQSGGASAVAVLYVLAFLYGVLQLKKKILRTSKFAR